MSTGYNHRSVPTVVALLVVFVLLTLAFALS